ncbi:MAG: hypothetical protein OXM87_07460 [Truepera sp.]|nr:hypothetical protein [Truepera sp.]
MHEFFFNRADVGVSGHIVAGVAQSVLHALDGIEAEAVESAA